MGAFFDAAEACKAWLMTRAGNENLLHESRILLRAQMPAVISALQSADSTAVSLTRHATLRPAGTSRACAMLPMLSALAKPA
jgi:hypothetical protein